MKMKSTRWPHKLFDRMVNDKSLYLEICMVTKSMTYSGLFSDASYTVS
jgi:hypothetical protein